jgi:hypothetical protein
VTLSRPLRESEFPEAHEAFRALFATGDPFAQPFSEGVDRRMLIFPLEGMSLDERTFAAIAHSARQVGEEYAFLIDVEEWDTNGLEDPGRHRWLIDLTDYATYSEPPDAYFPTFETVLFSSEGTWGLLISHALHAVVGSSNDFVPSLAEVLAHAPLDTAQKWLAYWIHLRDRVEESPDGWLPAQLSHIYGARDAERMLGEAGW